ncbi:MAG: mandelate racemase/muconate lactonizing enzyme family protein [Cyclobacteriaceae bacterium]|nr:mandelate racemase/muconate lactonizing enzyme family protein [Cyclobacteriaceae bacterium]UYN85479.1 MAG: mandelate racemase/muconate lactonizing enzyme family protein [Cyclobacteriaceae bacterium]
MNRRQFIELSALTGAVLLSNPKHVFSKGNDAVYIRSIDLLKWKDNHFVVVTSTDGVKGITLTNTRIDYLYGIFNGLVKPFFMGKDARQLPQLIDGVYKDERNYKFSGMPFWNCVGHIEVAIWDLLAKTDNKPVYQLLGKQLRSEVPMYLSSLTRDNPAEEEVEKIKERLVISGCQAVKIKVGGRMGTDTKADKRSYKIVELLRKHSDTVTIYADANSSFDVDQGIAMGKFLEDHQVDIFEEPCPWEDFQSNKKVADTLKKIKVAGGEQDTSYYRFDWYCKNNGLDVLQPDVYYNGGILRSLAVAKLAAKYKKGFAPHSPKADPLEAPFLHLAAVAPALHGFQEFPLSGIGKKQPEWYAPHFEIDRGVLSISSTPGLGIDYDSNIFKQATNIN